MNKRYRSILIYSCIFLLALIPCLIMFNKGFIKGHDNEFHYAQIQDLYDSIKNGNFNFYLNYETIHSYGMGVRLMYASLSHFITVFIGLIIIPFGFSLTSAMKMTIFLSILFSGIFTYWFTKSVTKKELPGIVAAAIYIMFPYRYTDIYVRNALAETVAMAFIPLVFYGIYGIMKQKEYSIKPYIATIIGVTLLFFSHNITTIFTLIFVVIFALFHFNDLKRLVKDRMFWLSTIVSCLFILCFMSILLVPMLEHMRLGIYRIFDKESMRSTYEIVSEGAKNSYAFLCGGLHSKYAEMFLYYTMLSGLSFGAYWFVKKLIKTKDKNWIYLIVAFVVGMLFCISFMIVNKVSYILYIAVLLTFGIYLIPYKKVKGVNSLKTLISFAVMFLMLIVMIFWGSIWKIIPSALYSIQFPWRLWAFVGFFIAMILGILVASFDYNSSPIGAYAIAFITCSSICFIKPLDKEQYNYGGDYFWSEDYSISIEDTYDKYAAGWQLEYFTTEYYKGTKSSFWWNLYQNYFNATPENSNIPDFIGVIEGNAIATNYKYDNGVITFDLECNEESLIEVARVYYLGYKVTLTDSDGNVYNLTPFSSESFVGFNVNKSGFIKVEYVGTPTTNMTKYLFGIAFFSMIGLVASLSVILKKNEYQIEGEGNVF